MKFGENFQIHITPEWRKQYVEYEKMKSMLYEAQENVPATEETDPAVVDRFLANFHERFFRFCEQELKKINIFYSEKLAESMRKHASLKADLEHVKVRETSHQSRKANSKNDSAFNPQTRHDLKLAFSEFYLSLVLLQNYQSINFTGFRKILKKHDKLFETKSGAEWRISKVETSLFFTDKEVESCIEDVENTVTSALEGGDRGKAMKRLRVPPLGEKQDPWTTFRCGLFLGVSIVLLVIAVITGGFLMKSANHVPESKVTWQHVLRLYRGPMLVILFLYLIGANTYGWSSSGVNHVLIFELDPRHHLKYQQFLEAAGFFAMIWGLSLLMYLFSPYLHIPPLINPLWMSIFLLMYLFNPFPILHHQSRRWLLKTLFRLATAPFHHVAFADFWLADQLNSLALVLLDFQYSVCFYASEVEWTGVDTLNAIRQENFTVVTANETFVEMRDLDSCHGNAYGIRPIIAILPAWFRFAQCWRRYRDTKHFFPHVVNAFKYSTSFFVVMFSSLSSWYTESREIIDYGVVNSTVNGSLTVPDHHHGLDAWEMPRNPFFYLWIIAAVVSSCYTYAWDIKMDWGLADPNAGENRFLREETVYRYKAYYYFGMVEDLVLRFTWTITMTVSEISILDGEIMKTITGVLEVFRRFIWNFFRLENEHLNNCGEFRAVRDISITPIDHSDQVLLEKIMDEDDGFSYLKLREGKTRSLSRARERKTSILEEEEEEKSDTWSHFKGGISNWLKSSRDNPDGIVVKAKHV